MLTLKTNEFIFEIDAKGFSGGSYSVAADDYSAGGKCTGIQGTHSIGDNGSIHFQFDRALSETVAAWFTDKCGKRNNTFGKEPNKLHFAVNGKLVIYRTIQITENKSIDIQYVLNDIVLAQGRSDDHNNWWFGGKNCSYIPSSDENWQNTVAVAADIRDTVGDTPKRIGQALFRVKRGDDSGVYKAKVSILHEEIDT